MTHGLALGTVATTLLLLVAGGLVTNTGAALAVPDWPTTFGHNMFLYPWSRLAGGVLLEHGHRLLGSLVGLLTTALAVAVWLTDRRGWLRTLAATAVVLVCGQGLLGGLRVVWLRDALAIVHGCLAQAFFALAVSLAVCTRPGWAAPARPLASGEAPRLTGLSLVAAGTLYVQVVLGALTTHEGILWPHVAGAVAASATLVVLLRAAARHAGTPALAGPARSIALLLGLQLALGVGAYVARFTGIGLPGGQGAVIGLPVAHRAVGALLLAATVILALESARRRPAGVTGAREALGARLASRGVAA